MQEGMAPTPPGGDPSADASGGSGRLRRWPGRWWLTPAVVVMAGAALLAVNLRESSKPSVSKADVGGIVDQKVGKAVHDLQAAPPAGVEVYDAIRPPLVVIQAERPKSSKEGSGLGSGIIVNARGQVLTSLHVVQDASSIKITFSDGTESPATIQTADADHDIAVLNPQQLPQVVVPAVLGGGARIGDETFAVGHPLGLVGSLSAGVVSGLDRSFPLANGRTLTGLIQFDAAVNPGNSGGPLLNRRGQVIGIVTGLANPTGNGDFIGIGFAVPISTAGGAAGAPSQ